MKYGQQLQNQQQSNPNTSKIAMLTFGDTFGDTVINQYIAAR